MLPRNILKILIFMLICGCKSQPWPYDNIADGTHLRTLMSIDFQMGFKDDTLSLWVENVEVLSERVILTVPETGFSRVKVSYYKGVGNLLPNFVHYLYYEESIVGNNSITIKDVVNLRIQVKSPGGAYVNELVTLDLNKGKYIGVGRSSPGEPLFTRQQHTAFTYYY